MTIAKVKIAQLSQEHLGKLRTLEAALGNLIIALEPIHYLAELSKKQFKQLQECEEKMDLILIAYDPIRAKSGTREVEWKPSPQLERADLSEKQFQRLQATEKEMDVILLASKSS